MASPDDGGVAGCSTAADCDDSDVCTGDRCEDGRCVHDPVDVDDHDGCTVDSCDPVLGFVHEPERVIFMESFASASTGWKLGAGWQIGPAVAGQGPAGDPGEDHTQAGDHGIAGVVLGGSPSPAPGGFSYLESPMVPAAVPAGAFLELRLWRWLDSDYAPYMRNVVDVFDGRQWVNLWSSGGPPAVVDAPPAGDGWFPMALDLTPYAGPSLEVRFGFEVGAAGSQPAGGFNVDDIAIVIAPYRADADQCTRSSCTGLTPYPVDDGDACTTDSCDATRGVRHEPILCEDGDACTDNLCDPVTGCSFPPAACDDGDACTVDACDPALACVHAPVDCSDGDPCTADTCDATGCAHAPGQAHGECEEGGPLGAGCAGFDCITDICAADGYCCDTAWDGQCVDEVFSICESKSCPESQPDCAHTVCVEGDALDAGCDAAQGDCVAAICAADSFCCESGWDATCVGEVASVCAFGCL